MQPKNKWGYTVLQFPFPQHPFPCARTLQTGDILSPRQLATTASPLSHTSPSLLLFGRRLVASGFSCSGGSFIAVFDDLSCFSLLPNHRLHLLSSPLVTCEFRVVGHRYDKTLMPRFLKEDRLLLDEQERPYFLVISPGLRILAIRYGYYVSAKNIRALYNSFQANKAYAQNHLHSSN